MCLRNCCSRCFWAWAVRAKTSRPLVSRSRRWTGRTRLGPTCRSAAKRARADRRTSTAASLGLGDQLRQQFVEGRLELPLAGRKLALVGVPRGGHARGLLHHHQVLVEIADADVLFAGGRGRRVRQQLDHVRQPQPASGVRAEVAAYHDPPRPQQPADLGPRPAGQPLAQRGGDGLIHLARQDAEDLGPLGADMHLSRINWSGRRHVSSARQQGWRVAVVDAVEIAPSRAVSV